MVEVEKQRIEGATAVGIAYGENQQETPVYMNLSNN